MPETPLDKLPGHKLPGQRPLIGWLWLAASALAALLTLLLLQWMQGRWGSGEAPAMVAGPMAGALLAGSWWLYKQGQRHFVVGAEAALREDSRQPIVYLRSFAAESEIGEDEMALARVLGTLGPFVAIGNPGDRLPPLGASRAYVPGDDWQKFVTDLVRRSQLVVVLAGATPGLGWELALCRRMLEPSRLVMLVAKDEPAYDAFRALARPAGFRLPAYPPRPDWPISGSIYAFVTFGADWQPEIRVRRYAALDPASALDAAESVLRLELGDLLKPRGIAPGPEETGILSTVRQHWRLGVMAVVVLMLWQLIEALGFRPPR